MAIALDVTLSKQNPTLKRRLVEVKIVHTNKATPSRDDIADTLSQTFSTLKKNIYVFDIKNGFGVHESTAKAHIYNSFDDLKKIEHKYVITRLTGESEPKIKRIVKKQARVKNRKVFGSLKRNMAKAARRAKD